MFEKASSFATSIILATVIILVLCGFIVASLVFFYIKRKKHLDQEKFLKAQFEHTILQTQLEMQEQTLKNISQEIHDNIGQTLSLAKLNINTMNAHKPAELQEKISSSRQLISKAIQDLRDLSKSMNTDLIAEMGLVRSIMYEAALLEKAGVHTVRLDVDGVYEQLLPLEHELILFRIFQEVVNNIIKHAEASEIAIRLSCGRSFTLYVQDNGRGFDLSVEQPNKTHPAGLGLRSMKNRAALIGGNFHIESTVGKGTAVRIQVPLHAY